MDISRWCRRNNVLILGTLEQFREYNSVKGFYKFASDIGDNYLLMVFKDYVLFVPCDCCQKLFMKGGRFLNV